MRRRVRRRKTRHLAGIVGPFLEPDEQLRGWFIGTLPHEIGPGARTAAAAGADMTIDQVIGFRLAHGGKAQVTFGSPFRGALVLTDRSVLQVSTTVADKPDGFRERSALDFILGIGVTGDVTKIGRSHLRQAVAITRDDTLVFDVAPGNDKAFDDFCERFVEQRDADHVIPPISGTGLTGPRRESEAVIPVLRRSRL